VRREAPGAVDDHPHGQADLTVDHRGLQLAVAQLDDLVDQPVNSQVGVRRSGRGGRRQRRIGQFVARQAQKVGIDPPVRCHDSTVSTGFNVLVSTARVDAGRRSTALGYALLAPSLFGVVAFMLLPIFVVVWLSLHRWDLLGPIEYVGGQNWRSVLSDSTFGNSLLVTLTFVAIVVPIQTVLGLVVAALLARDLPGSGVFRTIYVLPWISVPLAIAVLWRWILAPTDGTVSTVLGHRIEWLTNPGLALPVVSAVVVWSNVGYVALFFLAGILAIPAEIHSAARTDGATSWQRFWRITLPMLRPTMFFVLVTGVVSAAQVFDTVYALTGGGPQDRTDLVAHRIYAEAFGAAAIGRASVMAVVLFVILVGITIVQHLYFRKRVTYDLT
jgi:multiple sugar transport system permease protein